MLQVSFTEGSNMFALSGIQRYSLHCKSCIENHLHPCFPHILQTSTQQ
uniref:Uncharacterized protein MANES_16G006500 n=1 Tax=Rhizophora mucronata TaxID=61149 RepID=A0A2P2K764_RHIMU